jgi:hypothetical protein
MHSLATLARFCGVFFLLLPVVLDCLNELLARRIAQPQAARYYDVHKRSWLFAGLAVHDHSSTTPICKAHSIRLLH